MTDRYRDFDAEYQASNPEQPPISFKLGGQQFTCLAECPVGLLTDMMVASAGADTGNPAQMAAVAAAALEFFTKALIPEDRGRLISALHEDTPGKVIPILSMIRAMEWVVSEFMGKDSRSSSGSSISPSLNGAGSTAGWPARA